MGVQLNPYLSFRDEARAAMTYYHGVFGGELEISTFGENQASQDEADDDLVMHAGLKGEHGVWLMAADTPSSMSYAPPAGFSVALFGDDAAVLRGWWEALSDGGTIVEPLELAPWGDEFGWCVDRFGITWMVNIAGDRG